MELKSIGFRTAAEVEVDGTGAPLGSVLFALSVLLMPDNRAAAALFRRGAKIGAARLAGIEERDTRLWPGVLLKSIGFLGFTVGSDSEDGIDPVRTAAARFRRGAMEGAASDCNRSSQR